MRSTSSCRVGWSVIWWMWTSAMPGIFAISLPQLLGDGEVARAR